MSDLRIVYPRIIPGTLLGYDWFYVVAFVDATGIKCICDNANNTHSFTLEEINRTTDPHPWLVLDPETVANLGWYSLTWVIETLVKYKRITPLESESMKHLLDREIPWQVIVECQNGHHADRFQSLPKI